MPSPARQREAQGMRRTVLVLVIDRGNIAPGRGGARRIISEPFVCNALRNGYEMDAP